MVSRKRRIYMRNYMKMYRLKKKENPVQTTAKENAPDTDNLQEGVCK